MQIKISEYKSTVGRSVSIRCPNCFHVGSFEPLEEIPDLMIPSEWLWLGHRKCPNPDCVAHVFCIYEWNGVVVRTYPAQKIGFNSKDIPERIADSFQEAVLCHSEGMQTASAIMIRRTLEELCEEKEAKGRNLKERIKALRERVVIPTELFDALDDLRLLGNDAAHIEAKAYDSVGTAEVEAGIELTKEILKAVYQLDGLVEQLRSLRKS